MKISKVLKFGGSSIASAENINKVIDIILNNENQTQLVVFSAFGKLNDQKGVTDLLLDLADNAAKGISYEAILENFKLRHITIINKLFEKNSDKIIEFFYSKYHQLENLLKGVSLVKEKTEKSIAQIESIGEILSSYIIYEKLKQVNDAAKHIDSTSIVKTVEKDNYRNSKVAIDQTTTNLTTFIAANKAQIYIASGYIASNDADEITTLGRGGSDYTAALYASILDVEIVEIWTDVSGMYTCNPAYVEKAFPIPELSYKEAMELSYFGAKVIYPPTIQPVLEKKIPLHIKNTFKPEDKGTLIEKNNTNYSFSIRGITNIDNIALINIEGTSMVGTTGFSARIFDTLAKGKINIILITQASSEYSICLAINEEDVDFANTILCKEFELELAAKRLNAITIEKELSILAVVGSQMQNHKGIAAKIFKTLADYDVNIRAIAQGASERNISFVIKKQAIKVALNVLHRVFFEKAYQTVNIFLIGTGNIGKTLLRQMVKQDDWLYDIKHIDQNLFAIANSKEMIFDYAGIRISKMEQSAKHEEPMDLDKFIEKTIALGYPNSIVVDTTANRDVALNYHRFLEKGISIVTANKIAFSEDYNYYKNLRKLAIDNGASIRYETTVGAALPIIRLLRDLIYAGDVITKIEGVFSGSLNYIFSTYNGTKSFASVVKEAQEKGYTEPDPRIDLSGVDVSRKMLIVARESEYPIELKDIDLVRFLPTSCIGTLTVDDFYSKLEAEENHFLQLYNKAKVTSSKLKFISIFKHGEKEDTKKIELLRVNSKHPLYNVDGTNNSVLIYTKRYGDNPIVISGAGAGKEVTAMGVFADIINLAK